MRDKLEQVENQTGKRLIHELEPPGGSEYLLGWFWDLSRGRGQGYSGPLPLAAQEVKAWADLSGVDLEPWEFRAIRMMDMSFLNSVAKVKE